MEHPLTAFNTRSNNYSMQQTLVQPHFQGNVTNKYQVRGQTLSGTSTPNVRKAADIGLKAFKESMWLWTPGKDDHHTGNQVFLALSEQTITEAVLPDAPIPRQLTLAIRDRLLACVLHLCKKDLQSHIVTRFPTAELLTAMVEKFIVFHKKQTLAWIHLPTLHIKEIRDELLLSIVAWGAARSKHPDIRGLGLAIQETARTAIAQMFEEDNRSTRDLCYLQAYSLHLHQGLWSGVRRKLEIAESFMLPFVTMLRRGERFRNRAGPRTWICNDPTTNDVQWKQWVKAESLKRLALFALYEDTCLSMALFNPPLINPLELTLDLPCSRALWGAINADEWRQSMLSTQANSRSFKLTLRACIGDIGILLNHQASMDVQMSYLLVVCTIWFRVWQWRQMKAMAAISGSTTSSLSVTLTQSELVALCKKLSSIDTNITGGIEPHPKLFLEICRLHLHVSLEDIQRFAGKEGHEEARKMVTLLRGWTKQPESRYAVYHAGQILKQASQFPFGFLNDFSAVAVYHAGLVLWAYAMLTGPNYLLNSHNENSPASLILELVKLDAAQDLGQLERFFLLGKGSPCISTYKMDFSSKDGITFLTDPQGIVECITTLLTNKNGVGHEMSAIVSNLISLMRSLGQAASVSRRDQL